MDKFQNKYRTNSIRLKNWDYGSSAIYFITICTKDMKHYFGNIKDGEMQLNYLGKVVELEWKKSVELRPDMNLYLGEFVVMPNHFHGILVINDNDYNTAKQELESESIGNEKFNRFGSQSKNLASIIRGFKSSVTIYARKNGVENFGWHTGYYENIVRSERRLRKIQKYILNNPLNWEKDKFAI